jgi:hypothetical protein
MPRSLYTQGKIRWYPLDRRLGEPRSRSGRGGEEKTSQSLPGLETPIIKPVAERYTAELPRLLYRTTKSLSLNKPHSEIYETKGLTTIVETACSLVHFTMVVGVSKEEKLSSATLVTKFLLRNKLSVPSAIFADLE